MSNKECLICGKEREYTKGDAAEFALECAACGQFFCGVHTGYMRDCEGCGQQVCGLHLMGEYPDCYIRCDICQKNICTGCMSVGKDRNGDEIDLCRECLEKEDWGRLTGLIGKR